MDTSKLSKKAQAEIADIERERDMARAMQWPSYCSPQPIDVRAHGATRSLPVHGWWGRLYHGFGASFEVGMGRSSGTIHIESMKDDRSSWSQGPGRLFLKKADALRAVRIEATFEYAKRLAEIDAAIAAADLSGE